MPTLRAWAVRCLRRISTMAHKGLKNSLAVLFWLAVWQVGAMIANRTLLLPIPTPITTLRSLIRLLEQGSFYLTVGTSLLRIAVGFVLALIVGALSALLSTRSRLFATLTAPLLSIPRTSFPKRLPTGAKVTGKRTTRTRTAPSRPGPPAPHPARSHARLTSQFRAT